MTELAVLAQQLLSSGTHIVAKSITYDINPEAVLFYRAAISVLFYIILFTLRRKLVKKIAKEDILILFVLGALNIPANQFMFLQSIKLTSPPNVALAYALTPVFVLIIATLFLKERLTWKKSLGVAIAVGGAFIMLFEKGFELNKDHLLGNGIALIASFSWGLYTIVGKRFTRRYGPFYSTGLAMSSGLLIYTPIFLLLPVEHSIVGATTSNWLQLIYLGAITSGVAYALWYYALTKIDASKLAVFNNLQPVFTTIFAIIVFGHELTIPFLVGGLFIIGGVVVTQKG